MTTLIIIVLAFGAGALVTIIGVRLIERAHPPAEGFVEVGGLRQHVVELAPPTGVDNATPVVLLHGAGANLHDMRLALGERLAERRRVILVDRPGFGWSERGRRRELSSPAEQAAMLAEVLDKLEVPRAIVVGHSWGGALALTFALDFPHRVAGLVLLATPTHPSYLGLARLNAVFLTPLGWLFAHTLALPFGALFLRPGTRAAFRPQPMPERYVSRTAVALILRPSSLLANWADVGVLNGFLDRLAGRYASLSTPTVAIGGGRDFLVPPRWHGEKLAATASCVTLKVLPGYGHMLHHAAADQVVVAVDEIARSRSA
jgi:pimeloyl-ACP methyl ester carboxylesterase